MATPPPSKKAKHQCRLGVWPSRFFILGSWQLCHPLHHILPNRAVWGYMAQLRSIFSTLATYTTSHVKNGKNSYKTPRIAWEACQLYMLKKLQHQMLDSKHYNWFMWMYITMHCKITMHVFVCMRVHSYHSCYS